MRNFCKKHVRMRKIWYNNNKAVGAPFGVKEASFTPGSLPQNRRFYHSRLRPW